MTASDGAPIPGRVQAPVYALAFCYGNVMPMTAVVVPLWALELTTSPLMIGLVVASRQFLVVTLSIYGGALLDRAAPKRVILALAAVAAAGFALYPVLPFVWAAVLLQMVSGFAETTNWIGAQALFGRVLKGRPVYAGRLTAAARVGGFFGPLLVGFAWQYTGPTGAFLCLAGWVMAGAVAALFLPAVAPAGTPRPGAAAPRRGDAQALRLRHRLPHAGPAGGGAGDPRDLHAPDRDRHPIVVLRHLADRDRLRGRDDRVADRHIEPGGRLRRARARPAVPLRRPIAGC